MASSATHELDDIERVNQVMEYAHTWNMAKQMIDLQKQDQRKNMLKAINMQDETHGALSSREKHEQA